MFEGESGRHVDEMEMKGGGCEAVKEEREGGGMELKETMWEMWTRFVRLGMLKGEMGGIKRQGGRRDEGGREGGRVELKEVMLDG